MLNRAENEKIKRAYLVRMRDAQGLSEATVEAVEKAIWLYEDFSRHESFRRFDRNRASQFKVWLESSNSRPISAGTLYQRLKHLKNFFIWLSGQPGYRKSIKLDDVEYLNLDKNRVREAAYQKSVDFPSLEYVKRLVGSIRVDTEIDRRDKALISFLPLSGMRDQAIVTLPLGCFDRESLQIQQLPSKGVETKFGKPNVSWLFRFDQELIEHVVAWSEYLVTKKLFSSESPLFPRTKVTTTEDSFSFEATEVESVFWKSASPIREILRSRCKSAGIKYYYPHTFRHLAVYLAQKQCKNVEELKAVSQNFGHSQIATTMSIYGRVPDHQVSDIIGSLGKSESRKEGISIERLEQVKKLLFSDDN